MTKRAVLLALLLVAAPALANGRLRAVGISDADLALLHHRVTGEIRERIAEITVEQAFLAKRGRNVEAIYEFSLPRDATVTSLAMTMKGKWVKGSVLERGQARRTYERIVATKRDPALLERIGDELYRMRVFPLTGGVEVRVRFTYQQVLASNEGAVEFRYHSSRARLNGRVPSGYTGTIRIHSPRAIRRVEAPGLATHVRIGSENDVTIDWDLAGTAIAQDTVIRYYDQRDRVTFTLLGHRRSGENGTFLAILQPPVEVPDGEVIPKDVIFVLDRSGSMGGEKIREAKAALERGIAGLREGDRFNVLAFSTGTDGFREKLVTFNAQTAKDARKWIGRLEATGGTALDDALTTALAMGNRERLGIVALLTDGLPTVGLSDPGRIVKRVRANNRNGHRIFVFGVGLGQNARFLDRIAHVTRAVREDITDAAAVAGAMKRFFTRVERPVMTDLSLTCSNPIESVSPRPLPDLFAGDEVVVVGRYAKSGACLFTLRGRVRGREVSHVFEGRLPERVGVECLPRFWAQRQVDVLEAAVAAGGDRRELVPEIRKIATRHGIVTKFTAGLVLEPGDRPDKVAESVMHDSVTDEFEEAELSDSPFVGPFTNSAIGLGGGAGGGRRRSLRASSSSVTAKSVERGLQWLARQQAKDGSIGTVRETAEALLAFLAAGCNDRGSARDNPHSRTVRNALRFLMNQQDEKGRFGKDLRSHIRATTAVCEAFWMTRNPRYRKPAQRGLNWIALVRAPYSGWPKEKPSTLATVEAVLALKSGKYAVLDVDPDAFEGARNWFDKKDATRSAIERDAVLFARLLLGERIWAVPDRAEPHKTPEAQEWGALVRFQIGDKPAMAALRAMGETVRESQRKDGSFGSVADTAAACRVLVTRYRYDRIFKRK